MKTKVIFEVERIVVGEFTLQGAKITCEFEASEEAMKVIAPYYEKLMEALVSGEVPLISIKQ